jgi:hypothetical protein
MIEVLSAASNTQLVQLATVKSQLGIVTSEKDAALTTLIRWASDAITSHLGRPLARQTYRETINGSQSVTLRLGRTPVESVSSLTINGSVVTDFDIEDKDAGLLYYENIFDRFVIFGGRFSPAPLVNDELLWTVIEYVAGWVMPGGAVDGAKMALPGDIERAAFIAVKEWFQADTRDANIKSRVIAPRENTLANTIEYFDTTQKTMYDLPADSRALLRRYVLEP